MRISEAITQADRLRDNVIGTEDFWEDIGEV